MCAVFCWERTYLAANSWVAGRACKVASKWVRLVSQLAQDWAGSNWTQFVGCVMTVIELRVFCVCVLVASGKWLREENLVSCLYINVCVWVCFFINWQRREFCVALFAAKRAIKQVCRAKIGFFLSFSLGLVWVCAFSICCHTHTHKALSWTQAADQVTGITINHLSLCAHTHRAWKKNDEWARAIEIDVEISTEHREKERKREREKKRACHSLSIHRSAAAAVEAQVGGEKR